MAVDAGTIDTPLSRGAAARFAEWKGLDAEQMVAGLESAQPVPRMGRPEEIAQAVMACCCNGFMAGALVSVDGGYVAM